MKTNMATATLLVVLCCFHVASGVIHTYQHFYTATSGISNFPEFVAVGVVDGQQIDHYDSTTKKAVPKAEWAHAGVDSDYWNSQTEIFAGNEPVFKNNIDIVKSRFNQTGGIHSFQLMYGCKLEDDGTSDGYYQYGYDGEDFLSLDKSTRTWTAANSKAVITKTKWEATGAEANFQTGYLENTCIEWLRKYVGYGKEILERKVTPEVSVLQKKSSSPVVCHATGFYPDGVMITWKKDGVDMHEDVDMGETLPNEDGTFQKRAELKVSSEERKKGKFTCEVVHKSGEPIVKTWIPDDGSNLVIIIGCVIAALVLIGVVVAIVMMKKKKDYNKAEQSDSGSDTSDPKGGAKRVDC